MKPERPTIRIRISEGISEAQIVEIRYGIEEEGIPSEVSRQDSSDPLELAHQASLESRLGVGIGISPNQVVVTTEKLPAARPYLRVKFDHTQDRAVGANAARLVKRMPLLPLTAD